MEGGGVGGSRECLSGLEESCLSGLEENCLSGFERNAAEGGHRHRSPLPPSLGPPPAAM